MPIGLTIHAFRPRVVVYVEENSFDLGFSNNKVSVKHSDHSYGQ